MSRAFTDLIAVVCRDGSFWESLATGVTLRDLDILIKCAVAATVVVTLIAAKAAWASIKSDCMGHLNSTPWRSRQDLHLRDTVLQTAA